jgi:hypothetical protein
MHGEEEEKLAPDFGVSTTHEGTLFFHDSIECTFDT